MKVLKEETEMIKVPFKSQKKIILPDNKVMYLMKYHFKYQASVLDTNTGKITSSREYNDKKQLNIFTKKYGVEVTFKE